MENQWLCRKQLTEFEIDKAILYLLTVKKRSRLFNGNPRKSTPEYYPYPALSILLRGRVVELTKFDHRLANTIEEELHKLRCLVDYHALRFTKSISELDWKLVIRM